MDRNAYSRQMQEVALVIGVFLVVTFPLLLMWRAPWARGYALMLFFLGYTIAAANSTWHAIESGGKRMPGGGPPGSPSWAPTIAPLAASLVLAAAVFSALCWILREGVEDPFIAPMLAFMSLVPALGITPYFVLTLRQRFAAVVFTVALVGGMKLLGCLVVVLIYGWDADEQGRLGLPWHRPDLLVWLFWSFTAALSATLFVLAGRKFDNCRDVSRLAEGCPS
jgi:hypothetical protein